MSELRQKSSVLGRLNGALALLVSVRNAAEAQQAIAGGCDLLDIKEPTHGPMGMADPATIADIVRLRDTLAPKLPLSVALGEARDLIATGSSSAFPPGVDMFKVGTAGLGEDFAWPLQLPSVLKRHGLAARPLVLVAYADWQLAGSPAPDAVVAVANRLECAGVLIDTHDKSAGGLFDCLSEAELVSLGNQARASGLMFALAGRLSRRDVARLRQLGPDVVGIRSAACREGHREREIDQQAVQEFRAALLVSGRTQPSKYRCTVKPVLP
ncbi:MAG: (5-formylfuran-3-yl)methyl phosphate synthase [Planctomycetaceae bacterium]